MIYLSDGTVVSRDDYYISHQSNGIDELVVEFSQEDQNVYAKLEEGKTRLQETTEKQRFIVCKINTVQGIVRVTGRLDLFDWQKDLLINTADLNSPGFSHTLNETNMLSRIMQAPGLSSWSMISTVSSHYTRSMEMAGPTPLEAALQLQETFGCALRFDTDQKTVTILNPLEAQVSNSYVIESVNLRRSPEYKGRSTELYTRLYPVGKDGLGIASVNHGVAYLDNTAYTGAGVVICALWKDARYTDATSLKRDAQARLEAAARPVRSWKGGVKKMSKQDFVRKLTSRKLWLAVALFVSGVLTAVGKKETAETVAGLIMQAAAVLAYIVGEGLVDAANKPTEEQKEEIVNE